MAPPAGTYNELNQYVSEIIDNLFYAISLTATTMYMCVCAHATAIIQIITIILAVWIQAEWGEVV